MRNTSIYLGWCREKERGAQRSSDWDATIKPTQNGEVTIKKRKKNTFLAAGKQGNLNRGGRRELVGRLLGFHHGEKMKGSIGLKKGGGVDLGKTLAATCRRSGWSKPEMPVSRHLPEVTGEGTGNRTSSGGLQRARVSVVRKGGEIKEFKQSNQKS